MEIFRKLKTLKSDITSSPDYGREATRRARILVDEIMSTIMKHQARTMPRTSYGGIKSNLSGMSSGFSTNNVLSNIMGTSSPYKKNRIAIIVDINGIQSKISRDPKISQQVTNFVNRKLEMIKGMK